MMKCKSNEKTIDHMVEACENHMVIIWFCSLKNIFACLEYRWTALVYIDKWLWDHVTEQIMSKVLLILFSL